VSDWFCKLSTVGEDGRYLKWVKTVKLRMISGMSPKADLHDNKYTHHLEVSLDAGLIVDGRTHSPRFNMSGSLAMLMRHVSLLCRQGFGLGRTAIDVCRGKRSRRKICRRAMGQEGDGVAVDTVITVNGIF
jgi:hypothetical protein